MQLYPFLFEPNLHSVVWGGNKLRPYKGLEPSDEPIGESWEVSAVPSSTSIICNGEWKGKDLITAINEQSEAILGKTVNEKYQGKLPLLVKFIDAKRDLSIQVHPNDEMAMRKHGKMGKSEMWYVIKADECAHLYAGFKKEITVEEYQQRIADGTITEVLADHQVKAGDVFYLPAGRVHAICGGIMLAEVQQSSDVTYRIFDYNRPGMDGKPRELHTELAAQALDYHVEANYRTEYLDNKNKATQIIDTPYFDVRVMEISKPFHRDLRKYDSFVISMCIEGDCKIKVRSTGDEITLKEGYSTLIPAAIADYDVIPLNEKTRLLDAYIDNQNNGMKGIITKFLHFTNN
ncbi:class I mannose-6-phosphate isomerase [Prevotella communis]|nr:type I phosphomannose isomerase catalytic subunit [Prevotella communis]UKK56799.1 class I mannose-6-phosphate isomerase [Prevotella communis]